MSRLRAALPLILLVIAGILLYASGMLNRFDPQRLLSHQDQLHAYIAANPWLSRILFIGLLTLTTATGIPGSFAIIMAGGFALGVAEGTLYSSIGLTLGSLILYLASRFAFGAGAKHTPKIVDQLQRGFDRHPLGYTLFLRFIPIMPFGAVTVGLAWLRCSLWLFLGATWLGGTLGVLFETLVGTGVSQALHHGHRFGLSLLGLPAVWIPFGGILILAFVPLLIERIRMRYQPPPTGAPPRRSTDR